MEAPEIQFNNADPLQWKEMMMSEGRTEEAKLASAAGEFEALLLRQFLNEALKPLTENGASFGGNSPVYNYFITDTLASSLSKSGAFSYSSLIQAQLATDPVADNTLSDDDL